MQRMGHAGQPANRKLARITPLSLDADGRIYALNNGELTVLGR